MTADELQAIREQTVDNRVPFEVTNIHHESPSVMIKRTEVERLTQLLKSIPKLLDEVEQLRGVLMELKDGWIPVQWVTALKLIDDALGVGYQVTDEERQAIREQYLPYAVENVEAEVIVNLTDEVERLRTVMSLAYEGARDNQRSWPERANKAAVLLGTELGKCICRIGDVASLSCPKHGLGSGDAQ